MIKKEVFPVTTGKTTTKIPGLDPGTYSIQLLFKESEESEEIYTTLTKQITVSNRTSTLSLIPDANNEYCINTSKTSKLDFKVFCENVGIDSEAVNGTMSISVQNSQDDSLIGLAVVDINDYDSTEKTVTQYSIDEDTVKDQWETITASLDLPNPYGKFLCTVEFEGGKGFSNVTQSSVELFHKTNATLTCPQSTYYVTGKDEVNYTQDFKAKIVDDNNNAINGVKGQWEIKPKTENSQWTPFGSIITSDEIGEFVLTYDIGTAILNGDLNPGDSYDLRFKVENVYLSSSTMIATSELQLLYDFSDMSIVLKGVEGNLSAVYNQPIDIETEIQYNGECDTRLAGVLVSEIEKSSQETIPE